MRECANALEQLVLEIGARGGREASVAAKPRPRVAPAPQDVAEFDS